MLKNGDLTYMSLFSCAGVGCYGFKMAGFECVATNELLKQRMEIQRHNHKCKLDSGYIGGDIRLDATKEQILGEIRKWEDMGNDRVDVLIATPPCQGMSVANQKKKSGDILRNSLVVESILMIQRVKPRFFVFENVRGFMKADCTAPDGSTRSIGDVILDELGTDYYVMSRVLNFKDFGSCSSRTRTLVIGVEKSLGESPYRFYPAEVAAPTLRDVIGDMPQLDWGEICASDFYHGFRTYPGHMRSWVHDLRGGGVCF